MKYKDIRDVVASTSRRLPATRVRALKRRVDAAAPPDLVPPERMRMRERQLIAASVRPASVDLERLLGTNDLVGVNYLGRALQAARAVCRVILRDSSGREVGYGTGFKVAPGVLLTNHHVLENASKAALALAEFDYELDLTGRPLGTTRFRLDASRYLSDIELDCALVGIDEQPMFGQRPLADYGFLRLIKDVGKINPGEFVTIIQHPSGQPKQVALRENELLSIEERVLWYQSDTAQGSSGAPVFNDSWQIVGLHHSGVPRTDDQGRWLLKNGEPAGADAEDGDIDWIANEGIRASRIVAFVEQHGGDGALTEEFLMASRGDLEPPAPLETGDSPSGTTMAGGVRVEPLAGGARVTVPLTFRVSMDGADPGGVFSQKVSIGTGVSPGAIERLVHPFVDVHYDNRTGYDPQFLGVKVAMPTVRRKRTIAKMADGEHVIPYAHFSVVVDKARRMALITASNVDADPEAKEPEPGRDYSRRGLSGLGEHDHEKWLTDPRLPGQDQLPDVFYTEDGTAFDKGHIIRRDDVAWGASYDEVRRANGDTYHTTNCSPQVLGFNRSNMGGVWGKLENFILKQAKTERYCLFAGPLFDENDRLFRGKDDRGEVLIQIPQAYWKIVVARGADGLEAFAFVLEQDLADVPLEFSVTAEWAGFMVPILDLEDRIGNLRIAAAIKRADQFGKPHGQELLAETELAGLTRARRTRRS